MVLSKNPQGDHPGRKIVQIVIQTFFFHSMGSGIVNINLKTSHIHQINRPWVFICKIDSEIYMPNGRREAFTHLREKGLGGKGTVVVWDFQQRTISRFPANMPVENMMPLFAQGFFGFGAGT